MPILTAEELLNQLNWRYATKMFDPGRKINEATISALEDSLVLSPSSFGLQPWKFIVVEDQEMKERLTPVQWRAYKLRRSIKLWGWITLNSRPWLPVLWGIEIKLTNIRRWQKFVIPRM